MGIKYLSRIIKELGVVRKVNLSILTGTTIVIDCSHIIYKLWYTISLKEMKKRNILTEEISEDDLINKFMKSLFIFIKKLYEYEIDPIFVFDGIPPQEKKDTIASRKYAKEKNMELFNNLKREYNSIQDIQDKNKIKMEAEKKYLQSSKIPMYNLRMSIKLFLRTIGVEFYEAKEEAEKLCTKLVLNKKADVVFSSDTDNLVLGCPILITEIRDKLVQIIYLDEVLERLNLTYDDFKFICILSGCDYNKNIPNVSFKKIKRMFENVNYDKQALIQFLKEKYGEEKINNLQINECLCILSCNSNSIEDCAEFYSLDTKINFNKLEEILDIFDIRDVITSILSPLQQ
jgi:5'-3' exonuclease